MGHSLWGHKRIRHGLATKQQQPQQHTYMESGKMVPMNLFASTNRDADVENGLVNRGQKGESGAN